MDINTIRENIFKYICEFDTIPQIYEYNNYFKCKEKETLNVFLLKNNITYNDLIKKLKFTEIMVNGKRQSYGIEGLKQRYIKEFDIFFKKNGYYPDFDVLKGLLLPPNVFIEIFGNTYQQVVEKLGLNWNHIQKNLKNKNTQLRKRKGKFSVTEKELLDLLRDNNNIAFSLIKTKNNIEIEIIENK